MHARFKGKTVTKNDVVRAIQEFDSQYLDTNDYDKWLSKSTYKDALEYNGKIYPTKVIMSKAAGTNLREFGSGTGLNRIYRKLGFSVVNKAEYGEAQRSTSTVEQMGIDLGNDSSLIGLLIKTIRDYESKETQRLKLAEASLHKLKEENARIKQELDKGSSVWSEATDELLKQRLSALKTSPLDTLVREAGVVLEDRLRRAAHLSDASLSGVSLVDAALAPGKGPLIFSKHQGEQQGVQMLYRGAMQFIRNPPMHNLIEYQASTAQLLIRLIDSLLRLLAEIRVETTEATSLEDIRRMLTRIPIPQGQIDLYAALYQAGDKGLTSDELARTISRSRPQLAGVLGALGNRVNGTKGLENKGGVELLFDISRLPQGEYLYRMKPIMRKVAEIESIVKSRSGLDNPS